MKKNPFVFDRLTLGSDFCGRTKEISVMTKYLDNGVNVLLYSKRRYGKSTLIKEVFKEHIKEKTLTIYIDLFDIIDEVDFAKALYIGISRSLTFDIKLALQTAKKIFNKATFSASMNYKGEFSVKPSLASRDYKELIEDAINGLLQYLESKKMRAVIAFDEFQQIAEIKNVKLDAYLRKFMQDNKEISYIFSGSKQHMLTALFTLHKSPLYQMATSMELEGIDEEEFLNYVNQRLPNDISKEVFNYLYVLCEGESKFIQQVAWHLYYLDINDIEIEDIDSVVNKILDEANGEYRVQLDLLSKNQKDALKLITQNEGRGVYTKEALNGRSKGSVQSAINTLLIKELLYIENDVYRINGIKFELWCKREWSR